MSRSLWGRLEDDDQPQYNETDNVIPLSAKRMKLAEIDQTSPLEVKTNIAVKIKNPLVTQTIEVMKQTEMLQSLIDTYSNKLGTSNYLLNPCQMIPEVDFPPENSTDFTHDEKFVKPIWSKLTSESNFVKGLPQTYSQINTEISKAAIRKAICAQLRLSGFTDASASSLVLFTDAIEEFIRNLLQNIHEIHAVHPKLEIERDIEITNLEKAYCRNRSEINEFKSVFSEYDKLMKESRNIEKDEYHDEDFMNICEMPSSSFPLNIDGMQNYSNDVQNATTADVNITQNTMLNTTINLT